MKNKILSLTVLILFFLSSAIVGQSTQQIFSQSKSHYEFPFGLIVGSFLLDKTIQKLSQKNQSSLKDQFFNIDRFYGDKYITSASLLGLYGISYLSENKRMISLSEKAILATVVTTVTVAGLKELVGRSRPYRNHGNLHFKPFSFKESRRSFPSGHSAVTFAISTIMANEIDNPLWKIFWYGSAATVAGARIYRNQHWLSDVIAGGAIGYFIANKTTDMYKNKKATPYFGVAYKQDSFQAVVSLRF